MNKTVTINISGIIFHIEEDAFESLSKYLSTIKGYFSNTEGGNEIMADIESRIAELLKEKISDAKQVVIMADVDHVKGVMGKPEDFASEEDRASAKKEEVPPYFAHEKVKRRLFRNPDDKAIGGVCSGLAAYFDIDTVWIRLAMFLLIFFGGLSLWVYIVLWIIMPLARTTADKFAMRGESANINNIMRSFKEEAEDVKARFGKFASNESYGEAVRSNVSTVLHTLLGIVARFIGLILLLFGGVLLLAYVASILGISIAHSNNDISHWKDVIFASGGEYALAVFSFIIVVGIPIFMIVYAGVKLLFKISYSNRWLNRTLGILWILGIITGSYVTVTTVRQFNQNSRLKESYELHGVGDTLVIKMNPGFATVRPLNFENADDLETFISRNHNDYFFGDRGKNISIMGYTDLSVVESSGDSIELVVNRIARGYDKKEANENARAISYSYKQDKNVLTFDEIFTCQPDFKFRAQEVDIRIKLPKGKVIYFDKSVKYLLDDVDNTSHTWAGDMVSRRWIMTDKGLKCIDCDNLENYDILVPGVPPLPPLPPGHVSIHSGKDHIEIDNKGIRVRSGEGSVNVSKEGVEVEEK